MASTPVTVGALSTKVVLDRVFSNRNRIRNTLVDSGFLNSSNYFTSTQAGGLKYEGGGTPGAEVVGCVRGSKAYGFRFNAFDNIDIPNWGYNGVSVAYFPVGRYGTEISGTGSQTTAVGEEIPFNEILGNGGTILNQNLGETVLNQFIEKHFIGLEETLMEEIIKRIDDPVNIKTNGDGENPYGTIKTYAQDVTAVRPVATQTTNLGDPATTEQQKAISLIQELELLMEELDRSESKVITGLIPQSFFNRYRRILDPVLRGQYIYKGVTNTDGSMPAYGAGFFTYGNIVFNKVPDKAFKKNGNKLRAYFLPSSAIAVYHPMIPIYQSVMYGGNVMFSDVNIQSRIASQGIGLQANHFNQARDSMTSDPILEAIVNQTGGKLDAFNTNTIRVIMTQNQLGSSGSLKVRGMLESYMSVLRTQPQYIQEWQLDPALLSAPPVGP